MRTLTTIAQLSEIVVDHHARGVELFVRISDGVAADKAMGCSTNHQTGQSEGGVSVLSMMPHPEVFAIGDPDTVATQAMTIGYTGPVTYLLIGEIVGSGSDGEPVLAPDSWEAVALIDYDAIKAEHESGCPHDRIEWYTTCGFCNDCGAHIAKQVAA